MNVMDICSHDYETRSMRKRGRDGDITEEELVMCLANLKHNVRDDSRRGCFENFEVTSIPVHDESEDRSFQNQNDFKLSYQLHIQVGEYERPLKKRKSKKNTKSWVEFLEDLKRIVQETGKLPSFRTKNVHIWRWLDEQVDQFQCGHLSQDHYKKLQETGFDFIKSESKRTPRPHPKKRFPLSSWIHAQRTQRRKGKLSKARIVKLNKLGFIWEPMKNERDEEVETICNVGAVELDSSSEDTKGMSPQELLREQMWMENYNKLKEFKKRYGHLRVPTDLDSAKDYFDEEDWSDQS